MFKLRLPDSLDRKKSRQILESAYNDQKGGTAKFNLGILARANRELGADFDLSAFLHRAPYNEAQGRIEMHLVSKRAQIANLDSRKFRFEEGEYITTEHSYKYTGTIQEEISKRPIALSVRALRQQLAHYGIGITEELGFNDTYALVMTRARAGKLGIQKISDLSKHPDLRLGLTHEFLGLHGGDIDVKDAYTTDAKIDFEVGR